MATLEALLQASGRSTGAYTSPHLHNYNERIRIDGRDVDDASLISAFEKVEAARGPVSLTYFEFGTLAAFVALAESGVQDWILEVGLGGRLDAVNVVDADLAIITSVDVDHIAFLGDNREIIGFEKAGILRPGIPAIVADMDPPRSVLQQAAAQKVELKRAGQDYSVTERMSEGGEASASMQVDGQVISLPAGSLPLHSVAAAVMALRTLEPSTEQSHLEDTLARVKVPGRFECLGTEPEIYVDVGHNPHAATWLCQRLSAFQRPGRRVFAVYAALGDKDVKGVALAMAPVVDSWYLAGLTVPRGLSAEQLKAELAPCTPQPVGTHDSVASAISAARTDAFSKDLIIVFGSFFTVAEARSILQ